jgi:hypothetical protein
LATDIFLSVGSGLSDDQEQFYGELRDVLRSHGLNPRTLGRTDYLPDNAPLDGISEVLDECRGMIVLALERSHAQVLIDRPGTASEQTHRDVRLPTVWNQIEATMAYAKQLPLLVIVDERLKSEGLLEERYDWLVLQVPLDAAAFANRMCTEFSLDGSRACNAAGLRRTRKHRPRLRARRSRTCRCAKYSHR